MARRDPASPFGEDSLKQQLKARSRGRRETAARLSARGAAPRPLRNDVLPSLAMAQVPVADLRFPQRQVRKLDQAHVREIAASIGVLGFSVPVIIGSGDLVLDGQARVEAAKLLGLESVPCVRIDHLSSAEQRLLRIAASRLGEKGQWDLSELKAELGELILEDTPIEITGFASDEIDQILEDEPEATEIGPLEPEKGAVAIARRGDKFLLGPHIVICGDATDKETFRMLMDGAEPARLVLTDQPYNVKIQGNVSGSGHREFLQASGELTDAEFLTFNEKYITAAVPWLCDGAVFGTFIDWRGYPSVHAAAIKAGLTPLNLIVWGKTNAGMGALYRSQHELLPLFKRGSASHTNNIRLGKRGRSRTNLWTYPGASSLGSDARRGLKDHPTVKPTMMLIDALIDLTTRGDVVLDPFLGSGSTLIACEKTGRVCRGVELDPLFVDVIIRRFETTTGMRAVLAETGECFADVNARRLGEQVLEPDASGAADERGDPATSD